MEKWGFRSWRGFFMPLAFLRPSCLWDQSGVGCFINNLLPPPTPSHKRLKDKGDNQSPEWKIHSRTTSLHGHTEKKLRLKYHPPKMKSKNPNGFTVKSILDKCWITRFLEEKFNTWNKITWIPCAQDISFTEELRLYSLSEGWLGLVAMTKRV